MALASARPFEGASYQSSAASSALRGLTEDLADLRRRLCADAGILPGDFDILASLAADPRASYEERAIAVGASGYGLRAALERLHTARLAKLRGDRVLSRSHDHRNQKGAAHPPAITTEGRQLVDAINGAIETALDAVLGLLSDNETDGLANTLEHCRTAVWEVGSGPVVDVLAYDPDIEDLPSMSQEARHLRRRRELEALAYAPAADLGQLENDADELVRRGLPSDPEFLGERLRVPAADVLAALA